MWQTLRSRFGRVRTGSKRLGTGVVLGVTLVMAIAIAAIFTVVAVSARRGDAIALHQQRQLLASALADRRLQAMLEIENVGTSSVAVAHLWREFDRDWADRNIGRRLKTLFGAAHVFLLDGSDRLIYALGGPEETDPGASTQTLRQLAPIADLVRGRRVPSATDELHPAASDERSNLRRPTRAARFQTFLGHPAIVAAVVITAKHADSLTPATDAPILIRVDNIDERFLRALSARLELPKLHLGSVSEPTSTAGLTVMGDAGDTIARFIWNPSHPGSDLLGAVVPFLAVTAGFLLLLAGFVLRYMRRTSAAIAAGEDRLRHLALHDPLSGLPNRTYFAERLSAVIETVRRTRSPAAMLSIDLDRFKDVNDTLGHLVGDGLIRAVAKRLLALLSTEDLVARLGGDEFAVIISDVADQARSSRSGNGSSKHCARPTRFLGTRSLPARASEWC